MEIIVDSTNKHLTTMEQGELKYTAFISYNSRDNSKAKWLQKRLESYNLPSVIANEKGEIIRSYNKKPKRFRIFRYVTDLVAQNLDDGLRQELDQSKYLIVICSPNSANAPWVRKEVKYFIKTGRKKQIIPFVIKGIPYSGGKNECFTPELKDAFPSGSVLGVSLNDYGDDMWIFRKRKAVAKMVSLLIDLPNAYDFIWNRYRADYIKSIIIRTILFLMAVFAICFSIEVVKHMEKPFEMMISGIEENNNHQLPQIEDIEISISIDGDKLRKDTIESLNDKAIFGQIPGRMIGRPMKLVIRNADCYEIDTVLPVQQQICVKLHRNPDRYGKIKVVIMKDEERLRSQWVSIDGISSKTNEDGELQFNMPLSSQRKSYSIKYGEYSGTIPMPCLGTNCVILNK